MQYSSNKYRERDTGRKKKQEDSFLKVLLAKQGYGKYAVHLFSLF